MAQGEKKEPEKPKPEEPQKPAEETEPDFWAEAKWVIADIKSLRPKWTDEQCANFLNQYEDKIRDRMIEAGWFCIELNLDGDGDTEKEDES